TGVTSTIVDCFCGLGFEGEYPRRVRHSVSWATICPLGQPNKAIVPPAQAGESQIEPWLALRHRLACAASAPNDIVAWTGKPSANCGSPPPSMAKRAGCQRTTCSPAKGKVFSLDIPFYRPRRADFLRR